MTEQGVLKIRVCLEIYNQEVITSSVYKFTDTCFVSQEKKDNFIELSFQLKQEQTVDLELLKKEFDNELIDQQVRYDTELKFGDIRNRIVEKAFSPVSK
jgi:His-Xaa-Ser system protein HxsD